ncbi:TetR/AcrR family transcriptional regulator [Aeromicrobium duanguangcaii]|uniref:TetR/AcrR family transcriptional regulator n=1 Tax=Aeromicrobium duanguangcaii TaxID=2968086 RepID=UPI002017038E|nr:TetR/AcrR family transcriptional regulator [Aeromicrobium duanguangcaii]
MSSPASGRPEVHGAGSLVDERQVRALPVTARGQRTRESLVAAARRVFERDGFINSRLTDIAREARTSIGTFYTYFDSKDEIFTAVLQVAQDDMLHPGLPRVEEDPQNIAAVLEASNRAYFEAYRRNAQLMVLLEQVATINPDFRALRIQRAKVFTTRVMRWVESMQESGVADRSLDPLMASRALTSMVSRLAYYSFALGEEWDVDAMVETSTKLWFNALGMTLPGPTAD